MIWSYLKKIGECTKRDIIISNVEIPDTLKDYINITYPNPPSENKVITVSIPVEEFFEKMEKINEIVVKNSESFEKRFNKVEFNDETRKDMTEEIRKWFSSEILHEIASILTTDIVDYSPVIAQKILRGEQSGNSVFYSITHFAKGSQKEGIAELPLWKIRLQKSLWETPEIKKFLGFIPTNAEMRSINWKEGNIAIFKFYASELLRSVINTSLVSPILKAKYYHICFKINGKWPSDYPEFVDYYMNQIHSSQVGTCNICGKTDVSVEKLLTKEIGFFTDDQWSTRLNFSSIENPVLCNECVTNIKNGFNYVKKILRFFIAGRGTGKNPFEMYILPYCLDNKVLEDILSGIENLRSQNLSKKINTIQQTVQEAQIVVAIEKTTKSKKTVKRDKNSKEKSIIDAFESDIESIDNRDKLESENFDYFDALLYPTSLEDKQLNALSYMIVLFTHPEGQASSFHNIIDVIISDAISLKKLGQTITEVCNRYNVKPSIFKGLTYVINEYYYPKFLADLLQLIPIERETFYRNAFNETKKSFLQSVKRINKENLQSSKKTGKEKSEEDWNSRNMLLLEITNSLMGALGL